MDIAEAGLQQQPARLSGLIVFKAVEERVLVLGIDPQLVIGLGQEEPAVKAGTTVICWMQHAVRCSADQLDCGQCVLEPQEVLGGGDDELPSVHINWLWVKAVDGLRFGR